MMAVVQDVETVDVFRRLLCMLHVLVAGLVVLSSAAYTPEPAPSFIAVETPAGLPCTSQATHRDANDAQSLRMPMCPATCECGHLARSIYPKSIMHHTVTGCCVSIQPLHSSLPLWYKGGFFENCPCTTK